MFFAVLVIRNAFLFSTPLYEQADMAADSILIEQARRFTLLVGNYSRERFNHPGPAYLYVESWGESLLWSVLHVVPTAWNGQLIALYALNALFAALVIATCYGWTRTLRGALGAVAVTALYGALHPMMFSLNWMPYVYVLAYFAFVVAIASVAAGRVADLWIAALTGWFLIHGHACFLLFVPLLTGAAVVALAWSRRRSLRSSAWRFVTRRRRAWIPAVIISALFCVPIVMELIEHWPGNFAKYFSYSSSSRAGGHTTAQVADYVLWFWWPHANAWVVPAVLFAAAAGITWRLHAGRARRFLVALIALDALSTAAMVAYTAVGIDTLNQFYIGYFYWSAPAVLVLVIVLGVLGALPSARAGRRWLGTGTTVLAALAAVAACTAFAVAPQTRTSTTRVDPIDTRTGPDTDPALPAVVAAIAARADGRPIVLHNDQQAWPELTGFLVQAERTGVTACADKPSLAFMVTSQFICTPAQLAGGTDYWLWGPGPAPHVPVLFRLRRAIVTARG